MFAPMTLTALDGALRASWGPDVCEDPADVPRWSPSDPARGQCGPTSLVVNDLLGGERSRGLKRLAAEAEPVGQE